MRVALADVGRRGRMELTFSLQGDRTVLRDAYCEVPFKVTKVLNPQSPIAHVILMHSTAGLFGGDNLECSIRVERGARVKLTQQSATKIHPSEDRVALQRTTVFVEPEAELQLYLEPIIPFAESRLRQQTLLHVESGGTLSYWEGFMTGRVGRGESWKFHELSSETQLLFNRTLIYLDRFQLHPNGETPSTWTMGNAGYTGIGLYAGAPAKRMASELHDALPYAGIDALTENLLVTRVVSPGGPDFHRCREIFCRKTEADGKIQP